MSADMRDLFDDVVGTREQRRWHGEAERLRRLEIDRELVPGRRLHRQIGRLLAFEDPIHISCGPAPLIATWLFGKYQTPYAIAIYIACCAVVSLIATAMMTDYTGRDISEEYHATA